MKTLNVGMIGYGFMGKAHSNGFARVNQFFDLKHQLKLKSICGRTRDKAEAFAKSWGYDDIETDWRKLIDRKDI
ncbi:MAG: Gfo/Idh/MocA family oxidoreductase, partial [Gemmataceae bacterium]